VGHTARSLANAKQCKRKARRRRWTIEFERNDVISDRVYRDARDDDEIVNEDRWEWEKGAGRRRGEIAKFCGGIMNNVVASRVDKTSFIFADAR